MTVEIHPCEPNLRELKDIQKALFKAESTDDNVRKLKAIEKQIQRHEKAAAASKANEIKTAEAAKKAEAAAVAR
jgi:hypothetical protein